MMDLNNICGEIKEGITAMANRRLQTYNELLLALELEVMMTEMEMNVQD